MAPSEMSIAMDDTPSAHPPHPEKEMVSLDVVDEYLITHQEPHGGRSADHITIGDVLADEAFMKIAHALAAGMNPPPPPPPLPRKASRASKDDAKSRKKRVRASYWNGYLPADIMELVLARMNPKDAVRLSTACRDWRAVAGRFDPTLKKTPWLLTMMLSKTNCRMWSAVEEDVTFKLKLHGFVPQKTSCCGCSQGWLVLRCKRNDLLSLLNPFSRARLDLPGVPSRKPTATFFLYMSSAPTLPGCVLLARSARNLLAWRPGDAFWTTEEADVGKFDAVAALQRQFYALLSSDGRLISFRLFPFQLRELRVPLPVEFNYKTVYFLVESSEEILLVCIAWHAWPSKCFDVGVYRLDEEAETWRKTESLGGRALFLNRNQGMSVPAGEAECGADCIYFTTPSSWPWYTAWSSSAWLVYDMKNRSVANFPKKIHQHRLFCDSVWITPCFENL